MLSEMPPHDIFNSLSSPVWGTTARSKVCRGTKEVLLHSHQKNIKKYNMPPNQLEVVAADRDTWCSTCKHGLVIFHSNHAADAHRHATSTSSSGPTCHICNRVSVRQTLGFAAISEALLNGLPLLQRLRRNRRTTPMARQTLCRQTTKVGH